MRKPLIPLILVLLALPLSAQQVMRWGVEAGGGVALMANEHYSCGWLPSGVAAATVDLGFSHDPQMNQVLSMRTVLTLLVRGGRYGLELPSVEYSRQGLYQGLYLQLPLLAHVKVELPPISPYRNHWLTLSLGPTIGLALSGTLRDEQHCGRYPGDTVVNALHNWRGRETYRHARRLDLGAMAAVGYQFDRLSLQAVWETGFRPTLPVDEAELFVDVLPGVEPAGYDGYLSTLTLRLGYSIPVKERIGPRGPENPFKR